MAFVAYACMSVCESAPRYCHDRHCSTGFPSTSSLRTLPMTVAPSSSGGVAIRYLLPVLLMTSCINMTARKRATRKRCILKVIQQGPVRI